MDEDNKDLDVSPEEQNAEEEMTREVNDDELREKLADEFGLDPDDQADLLDRIVEREKSNHEKLSGAIKQKINWREKAKQLTEKPTDTPKERNKPESQETPDIEELFEKKFQEKMEERELEGLNLPDDLRTKVKTLSKLEGISIREAAQHSYIKQLIEDAEKAKRLVDATPKRSNKGNTVLKYDPSKPLNPSDFDFDSEEGVKAWNKAKEARNEWKKNQRG